MASQTTRTDREHDPERRLVGEFMQVDAAEGLLRIGPHEVQRLYMYKEPGIGFRSSAARPQKSPGLSYRSIMPRNHTGTDL